MQAALLRRRDSREQGRGGRAASLTRVTKNMLLVTSVDSLCRSTSASPLVLQGPAVCHECCSDREIGNQAGRKCSSSTSTDAWTLTPGSCSCVPPLTAKGRFQNCSFSSSSCFFQPAATCLLQTCYTCGQLVHLCTRHRRRWRSLSAARRRRRRPR